ncbi:MULTISPECIES: hypothetical protein [unclassified Halobacillus]|uniref:hypothetical protein n=1 Tax=unclassified Halobacillus TaxID=2636472 RepID=UPI0002A4E5A3|nr:MULTISPECIES: hypothetical protein [unclassified Halobacillus]ELK48519.1 hypothetical protein D479_02847 [Halobacillus sp. BAB-2008]
MSRAKKVKDIVRFLYILVVIAVSPFLHKHVPVVLSLALVFAAYPILMYLTEAGMKDRGRRDDG